MKTKVFECFVSLSCKRGSSPFYVCRTQVNDRRFLRSLLKRFCLIHGAGHGFIICGDISWSYTNGFFNRVN